MIYLRYRAHFCTYAIRNVGDYASRPRSINCHMAGLDSDSCGLTPGGALSTDLAGTRQGAFQLKTCAGGTLRNVLRPHGGQAAWVRRAALRAPSLSHRL